METRIELACTSHMGKVRKNNEDNFFFAGEILPEQNRGSQGVRTQVALPERFPITVAVFDGMGGEASGETAAFLAAQTLRDSLKEEPQADLSLVFERMNQVVFQEATRHRITGMGCTAVLARFWEHSVEIANVGDSRAFLFRDGGQLIQVSMDHTDAALLEELGITNRKPQLTQYLGIDSDEMLIEPYIIKGKLEKGDKLLLCSDGLTDMVSNEDLAAYLDKNKVSEELVNRLLELALERGGRDNTTLIIAEML